MIYISADDYGLSDTAASRIETCIENGYLNKISVLPNGVVPDFKERLSKTDSVLSLHLNLVEGQAVSKPENLGLLVSENGYFKHSFEGLLALSLSPKREAFRRQIKTEIKAQIALWQEMYSQDTPMVLDSHQHTHMIPMIFATLMEIIREENIAVQYLRIPTEPILPYLLTPSLYLTYHPVNLIKQWFLNILGAVNKKTFLESRIKTAYFMGILFSGHMDEKRVKKILPKYQRLAEKKHMDIELLFHPGYMHLGEQVLDVYKTEFHRFYFSKGRKVEYDAVMHLDL